jgi:hypothetical protein
VRCPECGQVCDITELITRRWTQPWWEAPGFNRLIMPLTTLVLGLVCGIPLSAVLINRAGATGALPALLGAGLFVSWLALLTRLHARGGTESLLLALLAHVLFAGYLVGCVGLIVAALKLLSTTPRSGPSTYMISCTLIGVFATVLWACRRGERFIASRCIRRYIAGRSPF